MSAKGTCNPTTVGGMHIALFVKYGNAPFCIWDEAHLQVDKGSHGFEWANVSGHYSTELEDYLPMCQSCHRKFDTTDYMREQASLRASGRPAHNKVVIGQFDKDVLVNTYPSMTEAAKDVGAVTSAIANHLAHKTKLTKGFTWRYM